METQACIPYVSNLKSNRNLIYLNETRGYCHQTLHQSNILLTKSLPYFFNSHCKFQPYFLPLVFDAKLILDHRDTVRGFLLDYLSSFVVKPHAAYSFLTEEGSGIRLGHDRFNARALKRNL